MYVICVSQKPLVIFLTLAMAKAATKLLENDGVSVSLINWNVEHIPVEFNAVGWFQSYKESVAAK